MPYKGSIFCLLFSLFLILVSCHEKDTLFKSLPSSTTNIDFSNKLEKHDLFGILYYLYYYNGGGVSIGDINNDGLPDIYFTANSVGNNKLYLNKGNFRFEDITQRAGVAGTADWCTGTTMADVNGDGYLDIYVCAVAKAHNLEGHNELFINNRDGTFTERAAQYGLDFSGFSTQAAFFDFDHDGDLDLYLLNQSHKPNQNIVDTSNRRKFDDESGDRLFRNELISEKGSAGSLKFTDVSRQAGIYQSSLGYGLGIAVADMNNDGWDDIYIGNDFHENDYYYVNNGNGTFTESGAKHFGHYSRFSMGNDVADYNNDGQPDVITVDMLPPDEKVLKTYGSDENRDIFRFKLEKNGFQYQCSRNCLQRNNGSGEFFSDVALESGVSATDWSWCPLLADFDNDGNKDLFISSGIVKRPVDLDYVKFISNLYVHKGLNSSDKYDEQALDKMPDGSSHPFLFRGDGALKFKDVSEAWGTGDMKGYYNGAAYADLDNDGDLDIVINSLEAPAVVLQNNSPHKNSISLSFHGNDSNTHGIGAKAYIFYEGKMQYQQLMLTRGFQSSSDARLHFGVDSLRRIDSLLVVWPGQQFQVLKNVEVNKPVLVDEKNAGGVFQYNAFFPPVHPLLMRATGAFLPAWKHREDNFEDFNVQYLIPHAESTRGPKVAVGDVNGDGMDDYYACGAQGQAGALMLQQKSGSFIPADTALFNADKESEDVDALFFDANGDGLPDLYVVSGGNEYANGQAFLSDRLYLNNGKKGFSKSDGLPRILLNKSCVTVADVDKDGDPDLFVGTLADAKAFGIPQTSFLLINDGKGRFTISNNSIMPSVSIGMVTAASFSDINNDGWPDLVVAGEWMPLTLFINHNGKFTRSEIPASTGLWQTVFLDDVNKDGNTDIIAGNYGWNNKFWSGKNGPLRMYVADFDHNGSTDQLVSYTLDGKEYPFLAKDEVERSLPLLKKHYLKYEEYAGVEMKDVFLGWVDTIKPKMAERLGSVVAFGDGRGNFKLKDLPDELQLSPIFSFQRVSNNADGSVYASGGNFFEVIPYEGKYDAQALALFSSDKKNTLHALPEGSIYDYRGQIRDLKWLNTIKNGKLLIAGANNDSLLFLSPNAK